MEGKQIFNGGKWMNRVVPARGRWAELETRKCRQGGAKATGDGGTVTIFCLIFSNILTEQNTHFPQEAKAIQMPSIT